MLKRSLTYAFTGILMLILGCSTEKNTPIRRAYHNLTANYNIFFNGDESFKKGMRKLESATEINYAKILPVFFNSNDETVGLVAPDMERAIKKSTKLISMHSITAKPKRKKGKLTQKEKNFYNQNEFNKWVDDAYLLISKASFYKRDFQTAEQTVKFIISNYHDEEIKYKAQLYLLRTLTELKEFKRATELFDFLNSDNKFPEKLLGEYNAIYADFYIKQRYYNQAIPKLKKAIDKTKKKKERIRYTYILSQVYQKVNNTERAIEYYEKVIKMSPPYEMIFNAKINRATLLDAGSGKSREIKRELKKMLKDDKNNEFLDQIYYALGRIALNEGNTNEAIDYFVKSSNSSVFNNTQKVMSFLTLAEIYFNMPKYQFAQAYYDSTVNFITPDYPNYEEIIVNTKILNELVTNLNTVEYQDSLQKVATMSEEERNKLIDALIEKAKEEEAKKLEMLQGQRESGMYNVNNYNNFRSNVGASGKWYFYNPSAMGFGQSEFQRIWGRRKLEDNWRRSNKQTIDSYDKDDDDTKDSTIIVSEKDKYRKTDKNYYLADIPLTEEKLQNSHRQIATALFNAGKIYMEKLEDKELAYTSFEKLIKRYPDDEKAIQAYYYLYLMNHEKGDFQQSDYYKNIIIRKYPDSEIVQLLTNPNYLKEIEERNKLIEQFYQETFNYYKNKQYEAVTANYRLASDNYSDSYLIPKFMLLNSLAIGEKSKNMLLLKSALNDVVQKYPEDDVAEEAKTIIARMEEMEFESSDDLLAKEEVSKKDTTSEQTVEEKPIFEIDLESPHYLIIIARNTIDLNQLKFNITAFIVDNYDYDDYKVDNEPFNETFENILVKEFKSSNEAMEFYRKIMLDENVFKDFDQKAYQMFVISANNYNILLKEKSLRAYTEFFTDAYYQSE